MPNIIKFIYPLFFSLCLRNCNFTIKRFEKQYGIYDSQSVHFVVSEEHGCFGYLSIDGIKHAFKGQSYENPEEFAFFSTEAKNSTGTDLMLWKGYITVQKDFLETIVQYDIFGQYEGCKVDLYKISDADPDSESF